MRDGGEKVSTESCYRWIEMEHCVYERERSGLTIVIGKMGECYEIVFEGSERGE